MVERAMSTPNSDLVTSSPNMDEDYGRRRRGYHSPSPHRYDRRRPRSPSPVMYQQGYHRDQHFYDDRRMDHYGNQHKRRRSSPSPGRGRRGRNGSPGRRQSPGHVREISPSRMFRDYNHIVSIEEFEDKMSNNYVSRNLSPESRKKAIGQDYVRYVETFQSDDGPNRGEAVRCFHEHQDEEWFWEKYHPDGHVKMFELRSSEARENYEAFCQKEVNLDTLDMPGVVMIADDRNHHSNTSRSKREDNDVENGKDKETEEGEEPAVNESSDKPATENAEDENSAEVSKEPEEPVAPTIPYKATRRQIIHFLSEAKGFRKLLISEPMKTKNWTRIGWAIFEDEDASKTAVIKFDGTEVHPLPVEKEEGDEKEGKSEATMEGIRFRIACTSTRPIPSSRLSVKTCPSVASCPRRLQEDLPLLLELVKALDTEKGIKENKVVSAIESKEDVEIGKKVDLLVHYLRRVHYYSYYKGEEYNDIGEMIRKGSATYVRPVLAASFSPEVKMEDPQTERLLAAFYIANCVEKERDTKYQCKIPFKGTCKVFKAPEFVKKHLWNKHVPAVKKEMYLMAYLMDPHRPTEAVLNQGIAIAMGAGVRNAAFDARGRGDMMGNVRGQGGGMSRMPMPVMMVPPMMQGGRRPPHMMPGMVNAVQSSDPRGLKAYVDLDAVGSSSAGDIDYRSPAY
ncbi:hypothetical protein GUITHDRAFT_116391 [Guillardia theta CCMP2712]|uniref:C2H2-type domain-containing protein n=1 Tax=Guillardia theta (strain CCMP2712) TaxID=905079 RepID=L1INP0_GUITC|nr:hypothetical protein GUITHDRAFT_116391 [Guillardia theta CCMP2712]EKX37430.1 hypothetical protein GUITHDRAFT_116391 [Guillardia theta CCMP2712]|eukprot:XP_005824410.1 hypothetical protein GUITHDRAFT_116391 [Guillardia theta CCMP2712]